MTRGSGLRVAPRGLAAVAWANAATHLVAAAAMVGWIAPGLTDRDGGYQWATWNPGWWTGAWLTWHAAAASFVAVCGLLGLWAARAESPLRVAAIAGALAAIVGLGFDLIGQQAYIGMATDQGPVRLGSFIGTWCSGVIGNGFYSVGILLLSLAWVRGAPPMVRVLGFAAGFLGLALSPAAWWAHAGHPGLAGTLTAMLIPTVIVWSVGVARWAGRESASGSGDLARGTADQ